MLVCAHMVENLTKTFKMVPIYSGRTVPLRILKKITLGSSWSYMLLEKEDFYTSWRKDVEKFRFAYKLDRESQLFFFSLTEAGGTRFQTSS
jgi:hypothetical protein